MKCKLTFVAEGLVKVILKVNIVDFMDIRMNMSVVSARNSNEMFLPNPSMSSLGSRGRNPRDGQHQLGIRRRRLLNCWKNTALSSISLSVFVNQY
jgi:hypothetical protein